MRKRFSNCCTLSMDVLHAVCPSVSRNLCLCLLFGVDAALPLLHSE